MKRKEVEKGDKNYYKWIFKNIYYYIIVLGIFILINIPLIFNISTIPKLPLVLLILFFVVEAIFFNFIIGLFFFFIFFAYRYATTSKNFSKEKKTGLLPAIMIIVSIILILPFLVFDMPNSFEKINIISNILALSLIIFWVWMIVDAAKRKFYYKKDKSFWIIIIVLSSYIGSILYYFIVKRFDRH
jgi:hypothetical protein